MNKRYFGFRSILIFAAALFMIGAKTGCPSGTPVKMRFELAQGSKLFLKGTTNVNTFSCDCTDEFPVRYIEAVHQPAGIRFQNAGIRITVRNFDCRNRKIEADLQKAMKADKFPYIAIELAETWADAKCLNGDCKDWFNIKAKTRITITKVTKERQIMAKAKVLGKNRFQLQGEESLNMSEFGVEPPTAMFGLIKVNDRITFHFDLIVEMEEGANSL